MDFSRLKTGYLVHKNRMVSLLPVVLWVLGRVAAVVAGAALVRAEVGAEGQLPRLPAAKRPPVRQRHVQPHPEGGVASDKNKINKVRINKVTTLILIG